MKSFNLIEVVASTVLILGLFACGGGHGNSATVDSSRMINAQQSGGSDANTSSSQLDSATLPRTDNPMSLAGASLEAQGWITSNSSYSETYLNRPFIGNGYMALNIPSAGNGYWEGSGSRTFSLISGLYANNNPGMSISSVPNWSPLTIDDANTEGFNPTSAAQSAMLSYKQWSDMKSGVAITSVVWRTKKGNTVQLDWTTFAHRKHAHLGVVRLDITPISWSGKMGIDSFLDLRGITNGTEIREERRQDPNTNSAEASMITNGTNTKATVAFKMAVPDGMPIPTAINRSNRDGGIEISGLRWEIDPVNYKKYSFIKYVGIATQIDQDMPNRSTSPSSINETARWVAAKAANGAYDGGVTLETIYQKLLQVHQDGWSKLWESDVLLDQDHANLQAITRTAQYLLYSNVRRSSRHGIPATGLSGDAWGGPIFWDQDVWMFPFLLAMHPQLAKTLVDFRYDRLQQAQQNVWQYPSETGATQGAFYPWTTVTGLLSLDHGDSEEIHLQADIALAQFQYYQATGDKAWLKHRGWPVLQGIANYYSSRALNNPNADGTYSIKNVVPPDEYLRNINDSAFTNGSALRAIDFAISAAKILDYPIPWAWTVIGKKIAPPRIAPAPGLPGQYTDIYLQYAGYDPAHSRSIKQADVELLTYPFEYPMSNQLAINNLKFYSSLSDSSNGPGMTASVHAVIAAQYGLDSFKDFFEKSYQPYVKSPYKYFNETPQNAVYIFQTGESGFLQTMTNGFAGLRFREKNLYLSPFLSRSLVEGKPMTRVYLKGIHWQDRVFDVDISPDVTIVTLTTGKSAPVETPDGMFTVTDAKPLFLKTRSDSWVGSYN